MFRNDIAGKSGSVCIASLLVVMAVTCFSQTHSDSPGRKCSCTDENVVDASDKAKGCASVLTRQVVDAAEADVAEHLRENRRLKIETDDLEKEARMLRTQIDLLTGKRIHPPRTIVRERLVKRLFENDYFTVDNRKDGKSVLDRRFLDIPAGRKYRLRFAVELNELKGSWGAHCSCAIQIKDANGRYPSAMIGCQPFPRRDVELDIDVPQDATVAFRIGFGSGRGMLKWGDLRIYEVTEVEE